MAAAVLVAWGGRGAAQPTGGGGPARPAGGGGPARPAGGGAPVEPAPEDEVDVIVGPVHVRDRRPGDPDDSAPAGGAPDAADARRALEEPSFVTAVRLDGRRGETAPVAEALAEAVGVSIRSFGGLGAFASLSVRGAPAAHTEILIDGVPLSRIGFATLDLGTLDLATFERVDVYRGGVPVALGGAALGGAVNFVTPLGPGADGRRTSISAGGGSFGARRLRLMRRDAGAGGRLRSTLALGYAGARGDYDYFDDGGTPLVLGDDGRATRTNNGYDQLEGLARVRLGSPGEHLEIGERLSWKEQGVPGPAGASALHASLGTLRSLLDARLRRAGVLGVEGLDAGARGHLLVERQRWRDLEGEIGIGREDRAYLTIGGGLAGEVGLALTARQQLSAGLEGRIERFTEEDLLASSVMGGTRLGAAASLADELVLGAGEEVVLLPAARLDVLVTRGDGVIDPAIGVVSPGERTDVFASPRLGARWRLAEALAVKANAGRYHRAPTLVESFGDRGFIVGNPELLPETGVAGDVGLVVAPPGRRAWLDRVYVEGAAFASRARDLIALQPAAGRAQASNLADAWIAGAELAASARAARSLTLVANYTWLRSAQRSELVSFDGKELPGRPRHEAYLRLDAARRLGCGRRVEAGAWVDVTLASGNYLDAANLTEVPARRFLGAGVRVTPRPGLVVSLEGKNLLDEQVELLSLRRASRPDLDEVPRPVADVLGYPLPGRAFYGTAAWSF